MIFPNLPTDTLYKFLFIAGLFLISFSFYQKVQIDENFIVITTTADSLNIYRDRLNDTISEIGYKQKHLSRLLDSPSMIKDRKRLQNDISRFKIKRYHLKNQYLISVKDGRKTNLADSIKNLDSYILATFEAVNEIDTTLKRARQATKDDIIKILVKNQSKQRISQDSINYADTKLKLSENKISLMNENLWYCGLFAIVGFILIGIGAFWWKKIQKKQDRIIDLQLLTLELDYSDKLSAREESSS